MTEPGPEQQAEGRFERAAEAAVGGAPSSPAVAIEPAPQTGGEPTKQRSTIFELNGVRVSYGAKPAVRDINFDIYQHRITALIGPSGCGKSTLIRCLNRMNDLIPSARVSGRVMYHGEDLYASKVDPVEVRKRIGMVSACSG